VAGRQRPGTRDVGSHLPVLSRTVDLDGQSSQSYPSFSPASKKAVTMCADTMAELDTVGVSLGGMDSPSSLASLRKSARVEEPFDTSSLSPSKIGRMGGSPRKVNSPAKMGKTKMRFTNGGNPWTSMPLDKLVRR
jgi:hypothetical protein